MTITAEDLIAKLQRCKELPNYFRDKIDMVAAKTMEQMAKEACTFLFDDLDDNKHTEEEVKAIIDVFPESLSMTDKHSRLLVQNAVLDDDKIAFVPLLANEGKRRGVSSWGGLYTSYFENAYEDLARCEFGNGTKPKKVLEKLREMDLFKKQDIQNFNLLWYSATPYGAPIFEMLAAWDPDSLITSWSIDNGCPIIHDSCSEGGFELVLKTGMKYFPERLGFLFRKHQGKTACETAFDDFGVDEAMAVICRCIPPFENHSLIHRAVEVAPHLEDTLIRYYPNEAFKKDSTGRTLSQVKFHAQLRKGTKTYEKTASFFVNATDDQIEANDPRSGLFPFMMTASVNRSDLDAVYYLLRRCPQVLVNWRERNHRDVEDPGEGVRKRQREES